MKLNARSSKVDQHAMFNSRSAQVAKNLRSVFISEGADCFEFNNEFVIDHKVGDEIAQRAAVLIVNRDR